MNGEMPRNSIPRSLNSRSTSSPSASADTKPQRSSARPPSERHSRHSFCKSDTVSTSRRPSTRIVVVFPSTVFTIRIVISWSVPQRALTSGSQARFVPDGGSHASLR